MGGTGEYLPFACRAVALDFDGVVVDSMPEQERAWRESARRAGLDQANERLLIDNLYSGKARDRMWDGLALPDERKLTLRSLKDSIWHRDRLHVRLMTGAEDVLPRLCQRMPLGIATTADHDYVESVLGRVGLRSCIAHVVTDADVEFPKPAPDMLIVLAELIGVATATLCMVGDTRSDEQMSLSAGCPFIGFGRGWTDASTLSVRSANDWIELGRMLGL